MYAKDALPHLRDGAFFLLTPRLRGNGMVWNFKVLLIGKDGEEIPGAWGTAKREVERLGVLEPYFHGKAQAWRHK